MPDQHPPLRSITTRATDWDRWLGVFTPDAHVGYTSSGGIAGTATELRAWLPDALALFSWSMQAVLTHEVRFDGMLRSMVAPSG